METSEMTKRLQREYGSIEREGMGAVMQIIDASDANDPYVKEAALSLCEGCGKYGMAYRPADNQLVCERCFATQPAKGDLVTVMAELVARKATLRSNTKAEKAPKAEKAARTPRAAKTDAEGVYRCNVCGKRLGASLATLQSRERGFTCKPCWDKGERPAVAEQPGDVLEQVYEATQANKKASRKAKAAQAPDASAVELAEEILREANEDADEATEE